MSAQQKVEKITHLQAQLRNPKLFEFSLRNSMTIQQFYNRRINRYSSL